MYFVISSSRACLERTFLLQYMAGALSPSNDRVLFHIATYLCRTHGS
jgi:hypothetical protein